MANAKQPEKSWFKSKGVNGGLVSLVAMLAMVLQVTGVMELTAEDQEAITALIVGGIGLAGSVVAVWGRISAKVKIGKPNPRRSGALMVAFLGVFLVGCATAPNPNPPPDEINVFAENVGRVAESTLALESVLVCGTWTFRNLVARPVVNALNVIPFFAGVPMPCPDP